MLTPDGDRAHGDVQTPDALARAVVEHLAARGVRPARVLEPTCGAGAFLRAVRTVYGDELPLAGIELRERYRADLDALRDGSTSVTFADACELDLQPYCGEGTLAVGNLPWVTTDALARVDMRGPRRTNPKRLRGLDAVTGASAFDVAELIALRVLDAIAPRGTFAMLLKESVARRLLRELRRRATPVAFAAVTRIDARRAFAVATNACLLELDLAPDGAVLTAISVAPSLDARGEETWYVGEEIVAGDPLIALGSGSALGWRQGLKHDAAALYELTRGDDRRYLNGLGEAVDVEPEVVFPFVRARDLARGQGHDGRSYVLVPYRSLRGSEDELRARAPRLHAYLARHATALAARRSAVYRNAPRFAQFGVGPYAFAPHKVAVSGLHRETHFVVLSAEQSVQVSDTGYALACETRTDAELLAALLNTERVRRALRSGIFAGKRPVTKRLLDRLSLDSLLEDPASAPEAERSRLRELLAHA